MKNTQINWNQKIRELAKQQRITLTDSEIDTFSKQLGDIADAFNELDNIDAKNVMPSFHPYPIKTAFRSDEPQACRAPLENVRRREKNYIKAPRILK